MKKTFTLLLLFLLTGIMAKADPIQINTQEYFDNWVAGIADGTTYALDGIRRQDTNQKGFYNPRWTQVLAQVIHVRPVVR